jgi:hypothetical protein
MLCASNSFHSVLSTILETNSHKSTARTLGRPAPGSNFAIDGFAHGARC